MRTILILILSLFFLANINAQETDTLYDDRDGPGFT